MRVLTTLLFVVCVVSSYAQETNGLSAPNYRSATQFSPEKLSKMVFSTTVTPNWIDDGERFWYEYTTADGKQWYHVDPVAGAKKYLFDRTAMAAQLTRIVRDPFDARHIPIKNLRFTEDGTKFRFEITGTKDTVKSREEIEKLKSKSDTLTKKVFYLECDLSTGAVKELGPPQKEPGRLGWAAFSPDTGRVFFSKGYNLYWMDRENYEKAVKDEGDTTIVEHRLTTDGIRHYGWGYDGPVGELDESKAREHVERRRFTQLVWSPDGKHFALTRKDMRHLRPLWVIDNLAGQRPTLETYRYQLPGEADSAETELHVFDAETLIPQRIEISAFKNQTLALYSDSEGNRQAFAKYGFSHWLGDNEGFHLHRSSRDLKRIDLVRVGVDGTVSIIVEERSNVYQDVEKPYFIDDGSRFIHWSQRDGWGHLYLHGADGTLIRQLTAGEYNCAGITGYNRKTRRLSFKANGREAGEDPYYQHHYSVSIDGGDVRLLNPGNYDHHVAVSRSGNYFVDNRSRVDTAPTSVLYDGDGRLVMELEQADLSRLFAAGYRFPEPFTVKAGDGVTDLYGVMYKPFDFDPAKRYPIVQYVYPGPQSEAVNKSFSHGMDRVDRLAQLGFIVVTVGNRGGHPARSKRYHTYGYGNLRDYGLEDKKVAVEQLAARHPFIDIERAGIYGHSGGGFMSTAAMLVYPDFFKVAVSSAGNHENNIYHRQWSERHHGVKEEVSASGDTTFTYDIQRNTQLAKNLKGKLLLVTGDMDNNVHPANTIRMVDALIRANKRFDFLLMPGQRHGYGNMEEYFFWKVADYFSEHLLGSSKRDEVDMVEINRERPLR